MFLLKRTPLSLQKNSYHINKAYKYRYHLHEVRRDNYSRQISCKFYSAWLYRKIAKSNMWWRGYWLVTLIEESLNLGSELVATISIDSIVVALENKVVEILPLFTTRFWRYHTAVKPNYNIILQFSPKRIQVGSIHHIVTISPKKRRNIYIFLKFSSLSLSFRNTYFSFIYAYLMEYSWWIHNARGCIPNLKS